MSVFDEFHMGEHLAHKSGGIRTLFRLTESEVLERRARVRTILDQKSGLTLVETPDGPGLDFAQVRASNIPRVLNLLEEHSILLDALHYLSGDLTKDWKQISDITQTLLLLRVEMFKNQEEKVNIYNFVDINVGEIIEDFFIDINSGNYIPTEIESEELSKLSEERERFLKFFNHPKGAIMLG